MRSDARANLGERRSWISIRAYCARYDVNRKTVYKYLDAGLLASWQVGRVLRVEDCPPQQVTPQRPAP